MSAADGFDVFISYNSADRETAEQLADRLRWQRLRPWLDAWCLTPGQSWQREIVEGLRTSRACAVLVGPYGLSDWAREELAVAQDRAAKDRSFRLFMVLLPGAPEPFDPSLAFLSTRTWVDLRGGIDTKKDALRDLISAITGTPRRSPNGAVKDDEVCPYRGLESYEEEHARFFFGRDDDIARVVERVRSSRFVAVLGPSGSGKSSLVRAGVVPALSRGGIPGSESWHIRVFAPGPRPLSMLAAQLTRLFPGEPMQATLDRMRDDERSLDLACSLALAESSPHERVMLVADQFEELFTLCGDEDERSAFLANLLYAATIPGGRVGVTVGMRADFYHRCSPYAELRALVASQQFLVGPLGPDGLRQAVEEPAAMVGLELEAGLVDTILKEVAERPGALPLLEYLLFELWQARRGGMLTLEAYASMGGIEGALANRANAVYGAFTPSQQAIARRVLLRLTQPGEGTEDTRRRAERSELVTRPEDRADVDAVVATLADRRLLTLSRDEVSGGTMVEVAHEALIRGWPELRKWINEDRDALRAHRRLTEAAIEWSQSGRDEGLLFRGARLAAWKERDLSDLNELERDFISASREREEREGMARRRRARRAVVGLVVALVAISTVAVLAMLQREQAKDERDVALSRQLAASAYGQLPVDPERALLLALQAFEVRQTPQAEEVLRQATLDSRVRSRLLGHEGAVSAASFAPNGRDIVTAGVDGTIRLWDVMAGKERVVLQAHDGPVAAAAFSADGRQLVSAGDDGTVRVRDTAEGRETSVLRGHKGAVHNAVFSPDARHVASAGDDATVRVWDLARGGEAIVLTANESAVWGVAFSPDGRLLAASSMDGTVRVWDWAGNRQVVALTGHEKTVFAVAFNVDGRRLVSAGQDGTVRVWDLSGAEVVALRGHRGVVNNVTFSADGQRAVSAGADGTVRLWDWATGDDPLVLRGHEGYVTSAAFSPDGRGVVSASGDGTVRVWDSGRRGQDAALRGHDDLVYAVDRSPRAQSVASVSIDGTVRSWDVSLGSHKVVGTYEGPVHNVAFSPDGQRVATVAEDGGVRLWDLERPNQPLLLEGEGHQSPAWGVAFSPDGLHVSSGGEDGTVRVWDVATRRESAVIPGHEGPVFTVAFSPDGRLIASGGVDGTVRLSDRSGRSEAVVMRGHAGLVHSVAFSADGRRLVSGSDDATVRVWDLADGRQLVVLRGHQGSVWAAAFTSDDRMIVSAGDDGTVRVWEAAGRRWAVEFRGHVGAVLDVVAGLEGGRFASASEDATVRVWSCEVCGPIEDVVQLARTRTTRALSPEERTTFLNEPAP